MKYMMEILYSGKNEFYKSIVDQVEYNTISAALLANRPFFLERDGLVTWFPLYKILNIVFTPMK